MSSALSAKMIKTLSSTFSGLKMYPPLFGMGLSNGELTEENFYLLYYQPIAMSDIRTKARQEQVHKLRFFDCPFFFYLDM